MSGCLCHVCGVRYRVDLILPDALWDRIKPTRGDMMCPICIGRRIEACAPHAGVCVVTETEGLMT